MAKNRHRDKFINADADRSPYEAWIKKRLLDDAKDKAKIEEFIAQINSLPNDYTAFDPFHFLSDLQLSLVKLPPDKECEEYDKARKKAEAARRKHLERYEALKKELEENPAVEKVTEELGAKVPLVTWKRAPMGWGSGVHELHKGRLVKKVFKDGKWVFPWEVGRPGKKERNRFIVTSTDYFRDSGLSEENALGIVGEAIALFWGEHLDEDSLRTVYYREKSKRNDGD